MPTASVLSVRSGNCSTRPELTCSGLSGVSLSITPGNHRRSSRFQSTHPVRGATPVGIWCHPYFCISIHAPREGCDPGLVRFAPRRSVFQSTHPVRGATIEAQQANITKTFQSTHPVRGATSSTGLRRPTSKFQSTHPVRGATQPHRVPGGFLRFQSTHPVRGATDRQTPVQRIRAISIHAPREGCDCLTTTVSPSGALFQSTHPVRGATRARKQADILTAFQSTHPVRGATTNMILSNSGLIFQSTHPVRGATCGGATRYAEHMISIHAPREGCDYTYGMRIVAGSRFQSTHPVRGATLGESDKQANMEFQSTHPVRGATFMTDNDTWHKTNFNPRTP